MLGTYTVFCGVLKSEDWGGRILYNDILSKNLGPKLLHKKRSAAAASSSIVIIDDDEYHESTSYPLDRQILTTNHDKFHTYVVAAAIKFSHIFSLLLILILF